MHDKEKLKKLLDLIEELLNEDGNEWLIDGLLERIEKVSSIDKVASYSTIKRIHEYCIKEVINNQAEEFYNDFNIREIKPQLVKDFKEMEFKRREDKFENFTFALYQQIEGIVNYLFENNVKNFWDNRKEEIGTQFRKNNKTVKQIVFENADKWYESVKFKSIIYFYYFDGNLKAMTPFKELENTFNEIYQTRNCNHRGSVPSDFQRKILEKIHGNESKFYLKFYGFLDDFIRNVNQNLDKL